MKYSFKYGGKDGKAVELEESPDMLVVRTKKQRSLDTVSISEQSRKLVDKTTEILAFPEADEA